MEPITGFFILEGLIFDIIGSALIVSGIFLTKTQYDNKLLELLATLRKNLKECQRLLDKDELSNDKMMYNVQHDIEISDYEKLAHKITSLSGYASFAITSSSSLNLKFEHFISNSEQKSNHGKIRAIKGLVFFIGGFLLQGIGAINQLLN